ncbi:quinoprotein dehydrogenase-associated SoxYZ-like carrier [Chthonobacter rhizosphaerae]|uniref:quinoprotein dehydrogenase-associated SoxYZ-like carrier n=1 Tax=Chthonobacter rhizosphaerae TaxID=2735553 RepID=UPI0015EEC150|nr:quinoprotein dehydrogenase-associated SoxYZ-like carrier [Chthonobacter rhizosphaerae]
MIELSTFTSAVAAALVGIGLASGAAFAETMAPTAAVDETWAGLVTDVFDDRPILDGTGIVSLEAPYRAEDAAIVPMTLKAALPPGDTRSIRKITLVIDQNPAPVAAVFELGDTARVDTIETRVRVNSYTKVHAVAEASDGALYMVESFVKASGGCSAPAGKDPQMALANLGQMKVKQFGGTATAGSERREAQVMIRHPQYSGLQMDQVTRHYIPAWFISDLSIKEGDALIMKVTGGISLSEDPNIRFSYVSTGAGPISVHAVDTEGKVFQGSFPLENGGT